MKITKFFTEIKNVARDSIITRMFDYRVNHFNDFYEIILHSEPTKKVHDMCAKNGFSITNNIMQVYKRGEMIPYTIWEVRPTNVDDIEIASDEVLKNVNYDVIIATDKAMNEAGMIKCTPCEGLRLWAYTFNEVWKKWQWTPIMRVFENPLTEDLTDDDGNVIEPKSTHKIAGFYCAMIYGKLDLSRFLEYFNVPVEKL